MDPINFTILKPKVLMPIAIRKKKSRLHNNGLLLRRDALTEPGNRKANNFARVSKGKCSIFAVQHTHTLENPKPLTVEPQVLYPEP